MRKRFLFVGLYLIGFLKSFSAEQKANESSLRFKTSNFTVISSDLNFKKGLSKESFLLDVNKKAQELKGEGVDVDSAKIEENQLLNADGSLKNLILLVTAMGGWEYEVLVYKKNADKWELQSVIPVFSKYQDPNLQATTIREKNFLILSNSGGGSGVETSKNEVYFLGENTAKKVLEFPNVGFDYNCFEGQVGYEWKTSEIKKESQNGLVIKIPFHEKYFAGGDCPAIPHKKNEQVLLIQKNSILKYIWDDKKGVFSPDAKNYLGFSEYRASAFLKHFEPDLKKIASGNDELKKEWLECFFKFPYVQQEAGTEVTEIRALIMKK